jgi:hypothetical protein
VHLKRLTVNPKNPIAELTTRDIQAAAPGWKWSLHVGPAVGASRCTIEHVGMVLSGIATAAFDDGQVVELRAGELFYIPPVD